MYLMLSSCNLDLRYQHCFGIISISCFSVYADKQKIHLSIPIWSKKHSHGTLFSWIMCHISLQSYFLCLGCGLSQIAFSSHHVAHLSLDLAETCCYVQGTDWGASISLITIAQSYLELWTLAHLHQSTQHFRF